MALRLWMGPSGSGKTRFLFDYVLNESEKNPDINYIVIVPEQFTLSTQREFIRLSRNHGILNVDVLSFARLAYKIFEEVGFKDARGNAIDDMGKNLILRHIASKCEDELKIFGGKMDKLGYITEVKSAISEFMQYGISEDKLSEMIDTANNNGKGQLALKLSDMKVLYHEFNSYIDKKYITKEEIITKAARAAHKSGRLKKSVVIFDGFTGFTPVQYSLIESLLQISRDIHVTVLTDTRDNCVYNTKHELFYLGYKTSNKLKKIAELNNVEILNDFEINESVPRRFLVDKTNNNSGNVTSERLVHLERNLFREYSKPFGGIDRQSDGMKLPTKAVNNEIRVFSVLKPMDEVRKVAVEIQKIIRESNNNGGNAIGNNSSDDNSSGGGRLNNTRIRYKNIAIATGDLETYAPLFKRVFAEYDIPYFIDKTFPVLMNPFIEYIRAILDIITENFSYSSVFRYLRSPLNDYNTSDIDNIENFVLKHGINGVTSWRADWSEKYNRYYIKGAKTVPENVSEQLIAIENIRRKVIDDLNLIVDLISDGTKKKRDLPTKAVNEINAVIIRLLESHDIENKLLFLYDSYSRTDDIFKRDRQKEYEKIYSLVISLLERMSELLVDEKITFKEYGELLDAGFDEIRVGVIPTITDYIQIGDITRSRFDNIHTLFIVGANEGIIPKSSSSGGIISDIEKEFLIESTPDIELSPTVREQSFTGQLYLYMFMTKPTNRLYLSYSRISESGESIRPSYIIKVIKDMFSDTEVERDFEDPKASVYNIPSLFSAIVENLQEEQAKLLINTFLNVSGDNDSLKNILIKSVNAAFAGVLNRNDSISKAVASVLYGKSIIGSVTRLEQYAKCSFNYFLKYGLSLKEREIFSFEAKDMGTVLHAVLEKYADKVNSNNIGFSDVSEELSEAFVREAINECMDDPSMSVLSSTFRHKYMLERIYRISMRSVRVLTEHIKAGDFLIKGTEVSFKSVDNLSSITFKLSDEEIMKFSGKIDRLDTFEDDEHIYVKIIDYKSGDKSLNLIEIYRGLSLQLVVYMNAATELLNRNSNKEIVPAGILYYHIDDPIVEGLIDEDSDSIADKIKKQLKMKGLVNNDENVYSHIDKDFSKTSDIIPVSRKADGTLSKNSSAIASEEFDTISKYVNKKIISIGREILDGNIKAEPHSADSIDDKVCAYCPYTDMCKYNGEKAEYGDGVNKDNVLDMMKEVVSTKEES